MRSTLYATSDVNVGAKSTRLYGVINPNRTFTVVYISGRTQIISATLTFESLKQFHVYMTFLRNKLSSTVSKTIVMLS